MAKTHFLLILLLLSLHHFFFIQTTSSSSNNPDIEPLLSFKATSDKSNKLNNWNKTTDPCTWYGVSCIQNRVSRLVIEGLDLHGSIQSLTSLNQLRLLSLKRNHLSGPIPDLSNLTALKLLFLSNNDFSGVFPPSIPFLFKLYRLDLSYNNLSGLIPVNVDRLTHLMTLRLEENRFSGPVSVFSIPNLQDFNVSGNRFNGEIPKSLSGFPVTAFDRNLVLCGSPLPSCKDIVSNPSKPGSDFAPVSPVTGIVSSSPSSKPVVSTQTSLNQLRLLSLKRNHLSGTIPDLSNLTALKLIFLSNNDLSGNRRVSTVDSLSFQIYRLDLSYNNLSGLIPANVNRLTHLQLVLILYVLVYSDEFYENA